LAGDGSIRAAAEAPPAAGRITMPDDWGQTLGTDFRGRVRYVRRFGRPTNLDSAQQVWLVCDGVDLLGRCTLNGRTLGAIEGYRQAARFDITSELAERNELTIDVELPPLNYQAEQGLRPDRAGLPGGIIGEVRLEIATPTGHDR
jgi:beta-galactosidase/beta-glucuronidase